MPKCLAKFFRMPFMFAFGNVLIYYNDKTGQDKKHCKGQKKCCYPLKGKFLM